MKLSLPQVNFLSRLIAEVDSRDTLGCDGCSELMSQLADGMMSGVPLDPALEAVQIHLEQCRCCRYEYEVLLAALHELAAV